MHASFVEDLLEKSVSEVKVATWLRLNVCWCTSEACKYKKRNHDSGHDDSLLKCTVGCEPHTFCTYCIFTSAIARKIYEQMVASIQSSR